MYCTLNKLVADSTSLVALEVIEGSSLKAL